MAREEARGRCADIRQSGLLRRAFGSGLRGKLKASGTSQDTRGQPLAPHRSSAHEMACSTARPPGRSMAPMTPK
jgi:hypothetical protein